MNEIIIKTPEEIEKMRELGKLVAEALDYIGQFVKPGVTTNEIDKLVYDYHVNVQGGYPAPLHYGNPPYLWGTLFLELSLAIFSCFRFSNYDFGVIYSPFRGKGLCGTNGSLCHKDTPCCYFAESKSCSSKKLITIYFL